MIVIGGLAFLFAGVLLGYLMKNPVLVDRERAVGQKLRQAKRLVAEAETKMAIAADKLTLAQVVREQTVEMLDFANRAPELNPAAVAWWASSPIYDGMSALLTSTASMPVLEAADEPETASAPEPEVAEAEVAEAEVAPEPPVATGARHQLAKRAKGKVTVSAMGAPAEEVLVAS